MSGGTPFVKKQKNLLTNTVRAYIIISVRAILKGGVFISPAGRPKIENPKNIRLEIRLTEKQNKTLNECAEKLNVNRTDVIIKGIELVKEEIKKK